jgi:hypothetical protein
MRRDYFELEVSDTGWVDDDREPERPALAVRFRGPTDELRPRLRGSDGRLTADETDVSFRLRGSVDDPDAEGVLALTNRITGDFVFEVNEPAGTILEFVRAARAYGQSTDADGEERYTVEIEFDDEPTITYEKRTFLVYDAEGSLLRGESLIPSGVEL